MLKSFLFVKPFIENPKHPSEPSLKSKAILNKSDLIEREVVPATRVELVTF